MLKSTGNNLSHPLRAVELDMGKLANSFDSYRVEFVTQDFYDRQNQHDPRTVYKITDKPPIMYLGDIRIDKDWKKVQYLLGYDDVHREYIIYMNTGSYEEGDDLVPVARFDDPQKAINALHSYMRVGSHVKSDLKIFIAVGTYINGENGINETITNIIANFGFRDDPRLQFINEQVVRYGVKDGSRDLPRMYRAILPNLRKQFKDSLMPLYADIYDIFVKYDFFREEKYHKVSPEELDLSNVVNDVDAAYKNFLINVIRLPRG